MDTFVFHPRSLLHSPSNFSAMNRSKLGRPTFSPKDSNLLPRVENLTEIADGPTLFTSWSNHLQSTVSSNRADGNLRVRSAQRNTNTGRSASENEKENPHFSGGTVPSSSTQNEIIALFRRIRTSIAKGESIRSKKKGLNPSQTLSAESISEILGQSRKQLEEKASNNRSDELLPGWRSELQKVEKMISLATSENRSTRPPSIFVKRSPVTPQPVPKVMDEVKSEPSSAKALEVLENLENMKVPALKELVKNRGIRGYYNMKKSELLEVLRANQ